MKTKFGNAEVWGNGYYYITSSAEGNFKQLLHRLVFEDFYGTIPKGCVIHHKDGNKTNNCIMNLQLLTESEHHRQHSTGENNAFYGRKHSEETKKKIRENHADLSGENHPQWKTCARVIKGGYKRGKQNYALRHNGKRIATSIFKEKLEKMADEINKKEGV